MMINNLTADIAVATMIANHQFTAAAARLRELNPNSTAADRAPVIARLDALLNDTDPYN